MFFPDFSLTRGNPAGVITVTDILAMYVVFQSIFLIVSTTCIDDHLDVNKTAQELREAKTQNANKSSLSVRLRGAKTNYRQVKLDQLLCI